MPKPENCEYYLSLLGSAKDSLSKEIIELYNDYTRLNPDDYLIQIERCKFLESAYYDADEGYNPKYEESEECRNNLIASFPEIPEVLIYKSEFLYGDTAIVFLKEIIADYENHTQKWLGKSIWKVYSKLADIYDADDKAREAVKYGHLAMEHNDTLDLTLLLAEQYKALSQNKKAVELLASDIDSADASWELNQKGRLLLELGAPDKAIRAFRFAQRDSASWMDVGGLAQAMIENGLYKEARVYLVKDTGEEWNKAEHLSKLFQYDVKYGSADTASLTYRKLDENSFWNDPVGIYRLRLLFRAPFSAWSVYDMLRVILLLGLFALVFIVPYTWILPIHYLGTYFKNKGMILSPSDFRWGLRNFWIASSLFLLVDLTASLVFTYDELFTGNEENATVLITKNLADFTIFSLTGFLLVTLFLVRKADVKLLLGSIWSERKSVLTGIGMAFLLKFCAGLYLRLLGAFEVNDDNPLFFLSIKENIISINQYYHPALGFLFVVLLVPVYEEIFFRGVFLSATEKYMKFSLANILQATVFALVHQDWKMFPFYLAFGLVAGYYRQKSQSLAPGISMHMTTNLVAFLAMLRTGSG